MSYSRSHYGLGTDDGRDSVLFGWRFTPTLIAVSYVLGTAIVLNDVKRTEAYARLSSPGWFAAKDTISRVPGAWWDAYRHSFATDKGLDWTMLSAALLYTIGFLAIAPLSSSLLDSVGVTVQRPTTFEQVAGQQSQNLLLAFNPSDEVYLRTVAHALQRLETSAWVTDDYAVLPFYPASASKIPLGPILSEEPQQWSAMTTVFKSVMTCEPMHLTETSASIYHGGNENYTSDYTYLAINVSDHDGCTMRIHSSSWDSNSRFYFPSQGGGSWFTAPNFTFADWFNYNDDLTMNFTKACLGREIVFASTPWTFENPNPPSENWTVPADSLATNSTVLSYICDTKFYIANTTVLASMSRNQVSEVTFDEKDFRQHQAEIPSDVFNTNLFEQTFLANNWSSLLYDTQGYQNPTPSTGGPLRLLNGVYGLDLGAMVNDQGFIRNANRVKQRFFGEMLISAFTLLSANSRVTVIGQLMKDEQRIVVNSAVAITLTVLLLLSSGLFLLLFLISGLRRRPLGLTNDPSNLATIAALALHDTVTRRLFIGTEALSSQETASALIRTRHRLSEGALVSVGSRAAVPHPSKHVKSWGPTAIKRRKRFESLDIHLRPACNNRSALANIPRIWLVW